MNQTKDFIKLNNRYLKLKRWLPMKFAYKLAVCSAHNTKSGNRKLNL